MVGFENELLTKTRLIMKKEAMRENMFDKKLEEKGAAPKE